jgi:hypothetical protein
VRVQGVSVQGSVFREAGLESLHMIGSTFHRDPKVRWMSVPGFLLNPEP